MALDSAELAVDPRAADDPLLGKVARVANLISQYANVQLIKLKGNLDTSVYAEIQGAMLQWHSGMTTEFSDLSSEITANSRTYPSRLPCLITWLFRELEKKIGLLLDPAFQLTDQHLCDLRWLVYKLMQAGTNPTSACRKLPDRMIREEMELQVDQRCQWPQERAYTPLRYQVPRPQYGDYGMKQLIDRVDKLLEVASSRSDPSQVDDSGLSPVKKKRSTQKGEARLKLISALTAHHEYADGGCLNLNPIGSNKLARQASVADSSASDFFNREFNKGEKGGHTKYQILCKDTSKLVAALKLLNQEFTPFDLYGAVPPGEGARDDE